VGTYDLTMIRLTSIFAEDYVRLVLKANYFTVKLATFLKIETHGVPWG
jgi:hypothetical protein